MLTALLDRMSRLATQLVNGRGHLAARAAAGVGVEVRARWGRTARHGMKDSWMWRRASNSVVARVVAQGLLSLGRASGVACSQRRSGARAKLGVSRPGVSRRSTWVGLRWRGGAGAVEAGARPALRTRGRTASAGADVFAERRSGCVT